MQETQAEVLLVADMAKLYSTTESSIRMAAWRGSDWLPKPFKLGHKLAWRRVDVDEDLAKRAKDAR